MVNYIKLLLNIWISRFSKVDPGPEIRSKNQRRPLLITRKLFNNLNITYGAKNLFHFSFIPENPANIPTPIFKILLRLFDEATIGSIVVVFGAPVEVIVIVVVVVVIRVVFSAVVVVAIFVVVRNIVVVDIVVVVDFWVVVGACGTI